MGIETLAAISIGTGVLGAGIGAYGAIQGGQAQSSAYTYQSQVAKNNAEIARQGEAIALRNAEYRRASGDVEGQIAGIKQRQQLGATKASQASRGIDVGSGSPLAVREGEAKIASFEQMMISSNAGREAYGQEIEAHNKRVEAYNFERQADVDVAAGKQATKAAGISAFSSVVGGASSVSDKWLKYSTAGVYA